jgi:glycosyltransferase involved in cell wall biosynthesis
MQRIMYLASTLARSGPTQQLLNIVSGLDRNHWQPVVVTLSPEPRDSRRKDFETASVELATLGLSRRETMLNGGRALRREVERLRPVLVHSHGVRSDLLAARLRRLPRVTTVRNVPWLDYPMTYGPAGYALAAIHVAALRRFSAVAAVSATVRASLARFVPGVEVIRNGVDLAYFRPADPGEKRALRLRLAVPPDDVVVVATGHLTKRKNPRVLIDAARAAANVFLLLVGDGPEAGSIADATAGLANIRLVGRQADVRPYLVMADLFASASSAEGFPNAVLEALACGLPCALSDIGPHAELASIGGATIRFFPATGTASRDTLTELLATAKDWATRQAGLRSRSFAEQRLGAALMAERYQGLYDAQLAGPPLP